MISCVVCGRPFKAKRSNQLYCSKKCRTARYNKRHWQKYKDREKLRNKDKYRKGKPDAK